MDLTQTIDSLGLGGTVRSELEFIDLVERGLPLETLDELKALGDLSDMEMAQIIPRRALSKARRSERLSPELSDRVARVAGIIALAHATFLDRERANDWLRRPNGALANKTPLSLLRSGSGAELVEQILGRIAYGVYS